MKVKICVFALCRCDVFDMYCGQDTRVLLSDVEN